MSKRRATSTIPVRRGHRPLEPRAEVLLGVGLLAIVVGVAVVLTGQLEVPGSAHLSAARVALFAVVGGVVSVAVAIRAGPLRRRWPPL
jgi:hypothetical protein